MKLRLFIFIILIIISHIENSIISNTNSLINARINCEYKDKDQESLVLNCTLSTILNGNTHLAGSNLDSNANTNTNANLDSGSIQASSSNSYNLKVGLERSWRTPWESLSINHNIIRTFIWRNSRLSELGDYAFKDLNYLQRVDLSYNKLQTLSPNTFANFEFGLIELDLSYNLFQHVPFEVFTSKRAQNIEVLKLNDNPIVSLNRRPFELIKNSLKTVELNHCQIRSIDLNTFDDMKQLESVSLVGNHLRYLNEQTFISLNLRSFYLHDNPLICDCHMRWLISYLKNVDYQQQIYESQILATSSSENIELDMNNGPLGGVGSMLWRSPIKKSNQKAQFLSVAAAAQQLLKCDQPNSLKSKPDFLNINPDSFMCDVQVNLRDQITEATYDVGEDAIIVCDVYGDPEPNVYWSFGMKPIEKALNNEDDKYYINEKSTSSGKAATNKVSELRIKNLKSSDFGVYTCTGEIVGSNNRKQISFNLKQARTNSLASLTGSGFVAGSMGFLASLASSIFQRPLSNWTVLLILAILVSLLVFICVLSMFICWKCRRSNGSSSSKKKAAKLINDELMIITNKKEKEKLLLSNGIDQIDHHNQNHYNHLSNESSTTLLSSNHTNNNKMTNSIRMAYPNSHHNHVPINDIYANHSLLTTTSTATGSYLAAQHQQQSVAIDASNQTPRYHLLNQPNHNDGLNGGAYYDDLRQMNEDPNNLYSSPYRQQQQSSYSPIVRRDDPTIPLYATLKPKLMHQHHMQHQQRLQYSGTNNYSNSSNYAPYLTIHRNNNNNSNDNTPPLPLPRKMPNNYQQQLPPPPPPPPILPPVKPKRTFEYGSELHSESGAYLLENDFEQNNSPILPQNDQTYDPVVAAKQNIKRMMMANNQQQGSTTSLDEEDLDLNDLKDFEDVTFDNLRKPGEDRKSTNLQQSSSSYSNKLKQDIHHLEQHKPLVYIEHNKQLVNQQQKQFYKQQKHNRNHHIVDSNQITNSEQSLLLKSSSSSDKSSSENTINNLVNTNNLNSKNDGNIGIETNNGSRSSSQQQSPSENLLLLNSENSGDENTTNRTSSKLVDPVGANSEQNKVYEETEI